ncbi:MAG: NUDIX hydrolase [Mobiluncus porci]|uniref:NUDIX hydrolase n=1 Tax=Mobiluncus porci TaxID=2652278 RepID=A0A7K0K0R5_9ACTO|nr:MULTISPECIES: NUDIX hydrolase [Mobiluncus]MCI6583570.1 NUDIX hydrolase [Mobiluncus sp.]MDD7540948.1 NUDIX hydrolase [Mobiluncus porci]MDY5748977.1 NUDIX hydrolase [Mobiluncus porci]MST49087.1 NUDIX hydrolase [Mobiluncus porci]
MAREQDETEPSTTTPEGFYRSRSGRLLPIVEEVSAGGLAVDLVNGKISAALILRRSRAGRLEWLLPKGHVEEGETPAEAAAREIHEETGIECRPVRFLSSMDYWFSGPDRRVHKVVHHFLCETTGGSLTVEDDPDHEAAAAQWVPLSLLQQRLAYPAERRIAAIATRLLTRRPRD